MFDIIGTITNLIDNTDPENPVFEAIEGFHVNTLPEYMTPELEAYVVTPTAKRRMYSGRPDTVCLKFASEAEFIEVTGYGQDESL